MAMTMTGTTTISITEKASINRPRSASAIGPLGLRTTARSHAPARSDAPTVIAQRCDLVKACFTPSTVPFIEDAGVRVKLPIVSRNDSFFRSLRREIVLSLALRQRAGRRWRRGRRGLAQRILDGTDVGLQPVLQHRDLVFDLLVGRLLLVDLILQRLDLRGVGTWRRGR